MFFCGVVVPHNMHFMAAMNYEKLVQPPYVDNKIDLQYGVLFSTSVEPAITTESPFECGD